MVAIASMNALRKKGAPIPANSNTKPPIKGPGIRAILETDWVTPRVLPCVLCEVRLDMTLGIAVPRIPIPIIIIVVNTMKM